MDNRMEILEYTLEIEDMATKTILFVFNVDQKNEKLIHYFKTTSLYEKVALLKDMNLISGSLFNKINLIARVRNVLLHNREYANFASIPDKKLLKEILNTNKTLPSNWDILLLVELNKLLSTSLAVIYHEVINGLNAVLKEAENRFNATVFTEQKKDALLVYKALNKAMHRTFGELGQYGLSKKKIEQIKSRHIDLFTDELEKLAPEKFGNRGEQAGEAK